MIVISNCSSYYSLMAIINFLQWLPYVYKCMSESFKPDRYIVQKDAPFVSQMHIATALDQT